MKNIICVILLAILTIAGLVTTNSCTEQEEIKIADYTAIAVLFHTENGVEKYEFYSSKPASKINNRIYVVTDVDIDGSKTLNAITFDVYDWYPSSGYEFSGTYWFSGTCIDSYLLVK